MQPPSRETILRDHFISQLADDFLKRHLRETVIRKPEVKFLAVRDEAIRWAEGTETIQAHSQREVLPSRVEKVLDQLMERLTVMESRLSRLEQPKGHFPYTADGAPICLRCKQPGHIARKCQGNGGPL